MKADGGRAVGHDRGVDLAAHVVGALSAPDTTGEGAPTSVPRGEDPVLTSVAAVAAAKAAGGGPLPGVRCGRQPSPAPVDICSASNSSALFPSGPVYLSQPFRKVSTTYVSLGVLVWAGRKRPACTLCTACL